MPDTCVFIEAQPSAPAPGRSVRQPKTEQQVDLTTIPTLPWALVNEFQAAAVLALSVKTLRRQRHEGVGPKFVKLNGATVRYRVGDLQTWLAAQPTFGGVLPGQRERMRPGRPGRPA